MICFNGPRPFLMGLFGEHEIRFDLVVIHEVGHNYFPMLLTRRAAVDMDRRRITTEINRISCSPISPSGSGRGPLKQIIWILHAADWPINRLCHRIGIRKGVTE